MDIYTDGHLDGLNGIGGQFAESGYSKILIDGETISVPYEKKKLTNNEAELLAIFHACMKAMPGDRILSDSAIAVNCSNRGKSKEERFQLLCVAIKYLIERKNLTVNWIKRENNPVT